jgi:hypothetical protein
MRRAQRQHHTFSIATVVGAADKSTRKDRANVERLEVLAHTATGLVEQQNQLRTQHSKQFAAHLRRAADDLRNIDLQKRHGTRGSRHLHRRAEDEQVPEAVVDCSSMVAEGSQPDVSIAHTQPDVRISLTHGILFAHH